jgi:hypothetical protein
LSREYYSPHLDTAELAAHVFLRSVNNITIERGWVPLRIQWGDNVKVFWEAGSDIYNSDNQYHWYVNHTFIIVESLLHDCSDLVQWLWPTLIQQELDEFKARFNCHKIRYDSTKHLPSGVSPDVAYSLFEDYGAQNCLQPVDPEVVQNLMGEIGGEDVIRFVSVAYAARAQEVFDSLGMPKITFENVWEIFQKMLPYVSN